MKIVKIPDAEKLFKEYHELQDVLQAINEKKDLTICVTKDDTTVLVENTNPVKLKNVRFCTIEFLVKSHIEECEKAIEKL